MQIGQANLNSKREGWRMSGFATTVSTAATLLVMLPKPLHAWSGSIRHVAMAGPVLHDVARLLRGVTRAGNHNTC